jgi:hypothetical protein
MWHPSLKGALKAGQIPTELSWAVLLQSQLLQPSRGPSHNLQIPWRPHCKRMSTHSCWTCSHPVPTQLRRGSPSTELSVRPVNQNHKKPTVLTAHRCCNRSQSVPTPTQGVSGPVAFRDYSAQHWPPVLPCRWTRLPPPWWPTAASSHGATARASALTLLLGGLGRASLRWGDGARRSSARWPSTRTSRFSS